MLKFDFAECVSPAILWRPARIVDPDAWSEHIPFAFWLIGVLRPRSVVELGTKAWTRALANWSSDSARLPRSTAFQRN